MAREVQLVMLRNRMLQRANLENSRLISTEEATDYINQAWSMVYEILVQTDESYSTTSIVYNTTNSVATYPLPSDFYKERGVDVNFSGIIIDAKRFMFSERNLYQSPSIWTEGSPIAFNIVGNNLVLYPTPQGAFIVTLWYAPTPTLLAQDTDTIDGIAGYEEGVILDGAVRCRQKEGIDGSDLTRARDAEMLRIRSMAKSRITSQPPRINRTRYHREFGGPWRPRWFAIALWLGASAIAHGLGIPWL